ncbi:ABC1 kinase family protein [Allokutzneria albata]|uniref:Ubiquinone biosynthesis protein n=1 Tax=Allokutzneria albata TaxID=211114 RepID=A0A1G9RLS3_ALLAB|nr:AarF/UbiB family protein [Allokutzneria albata]SDM23375.1 ubiquinone biosynthesis protein [Allokutzneria albata]
MDLLAEAFIGLAVFGMVLVFAAAVRRLLGMAFGTLRTLAAGLLAYLLAMPIAQAMRGAVSPEDDQNTILWFLILATGCAVLAGMVFLAVSEALVPTGSLPTPLEWVRGLGGRFRRARRYSQITRIAIRHGLGPYLRGRDRTELSRTTQHRITLARSLRGALEDGGVTFVKLGQILSTRRDLLPEEFVAELSHLRDKVPPAPWAEVEAVLIGELGAPVDEVFASFDRTPLAAASIAQVHVARLRTGEEVVVKVQRPGIRDLVERDIDIVNRLARTLELRTKWGRSLGLRELAAGFADAVREELDFRIEAANMAVLLENNGGAANATGVVTYPAPHEPLCGERVLVMQRLDGVQLGAAEQEITSAGLDRRELARNLLECLLRQIMVDGVFHADPHPGNVLLLSDGRLGMLDFGSVGRLDAALRAALQRLLLAMDRGDPLAAGDALLEIAPRPDEIDEQRLERALGQFMARHLGGGSVRSVRMFTDLFRIITDHRLSIPAEVAAVFRALATVEGALAQLAPGFDLVAEARSFARGYVVEHLDAGALKETVIQEAAAVLPMLRRLPRRVERIAGAVENGRLTVNIRLFADERDRAHVTALLHQVLFTVLGATAGIMAVMLLGTAGGPMVTSSVSLYALFGYNLLLISVVLVLRVLVLMFRR